MKSEDLDLKEAFHMFSGGIILHSGVCVLPHHVIDGCHNVQHLLQSGGRKEVLLVGS